MVPAPPAGPRRRLTGLSGPLHLGSASWDSIEAHVVEAWLRHQIELLTNVLAEHQTGLRALREPIEASARIITEEALHVMVEGTHGHPFLIQLVGEQTWRRNPASSPSRWPTRSPASPVQRRRLCSLVHEPALAEASDIDRSFLLAMAKDARPSTRADIQQRLDVDVNHTSQERLRLIAAELIEPTRHG